MLSASPAGAALLRASAAQAEAQLQRRAAAPVPGRLRAALLGTTQLTHFPAWLVSSDVLSPGFAGDSLIRHPVLPHSCSLTFGGAQRAALTKAPLYVVIKSFAGRLRRVVLKALPHNRFILLGGFVHEVPRLRVGPGSFSALKTQIGARTGIYLHIAKSFPDVKSLLPAAARCKEVLVKVGKKPF